MKKRRLLLIGCVIAALLFAGCKTNEVETEDTTSSSTTTQTNTSSNNVTSGSTGSESSSSTTTTDSSDSSSSSSSSSTTSDSSGTKDYTADNEALWAAIQAARKAAIEAGAAEANPVAWAAAEADYEVQKKIMDEGGSSSDMSAVLRDLNYRYQGLTALANAQKKKAFVDENEWASYNRASYDNGSKKVTDLTDPLKTFESGKAFFDTAVAAEKDFDTVINSAYRTIAKEERSKAFEAKKQADSVKAAVSRKVDYEQAVAIFKSGDSHYVTGNLKGSIEDYIASRQAFETLFAEISEARAQALAAIEAARKRVSESEDVALAADKEAPLGNAQVEGIEAEDAKLLDDDDFAEAESAQAAAEDAIEEDVE
jgi:hypothetical protein